LANSSDVVHGARLAETGTETEAAADDDEEEEEEAEEETCEVTDAVDAISIHTLRVGSGMTVTLHRRLSSVAATRTVFLFC
jgi:hypothetical protein